MLSLQNGKVRSGRPDPRPQRRIAFWLRGGRERGPNLYAVIFRATGVAGRPPCSARRAARPAAAPTRCPIDGRPTQGRERRQRFRKEPDGLRLVGFRQQRTRGRVSLVRRWANSGLNYLQPKTWPVEPGSYSTKIAICSSQDGPSAEVLGSARRLAQGKSSAL